MWMNYLEFPNQYETNISQIPREVILQKLLLL